MLTSSRIDTAYLEFNTSDPDVPDGDSPGDVASSDSETEWDEEEEEDDDDDN